MIKVDLPTITSFLSRTPEVIKALVIDLDETWLHANEGLGTWSPHEVVAHLIFGEQTDWIPRMQMILSDKEDKTFVPFDRNGHFQVAAGRSIESLLHQFEELRKENLHILLAADLIEDDLRKTAHHPALGAVTLGQLLASWVVHDMTHIYQISRTIARQYEVEVGPWKEYLGILKS